MYTALVLSEQSQKMLRKAFEVSKEHEWCGHHMTMCMGKGYEELVGHEFNVVAVRMGTNTNVAAIEVQTDCPSDNARKHITLFTTGGKPKDSNSIAESDWCDIRPVILRGTVEVVE